MQRKLAILSAPSNLGLMPPGAGQQPGVRRMAAALRRHGLVERLGAVDAGTVIPPPYDPARDPLTGIRNSAAIRFYTLQLADAIGGLLEEGQFPLVLGGDCSILLGAMLALRRRGNYGLVYFDGHRDFQTPATSATGGAAGMDLALVTGRGPEELTRFDGYEVLVDEKAIVALGFRDRIELEADGSRAIFDTPIQLLDLDAIRRLGPEQAAQEALAILESAGVEGFWIHLDVDVLDSVLMPAVDSPQPGGLVYEELAALIRPLLASNLATGMQVTIYDPDRDPGGTVGERLTSWLTGLFLA
ncbi:MAG: arginase family protein [Anaerolineae bacterium]|nr:arginase family protein [Anaerolineae bacterium]